jgi:hypothetical protein
VGAKVNYFSSLAKKSQENYLSISGIAIKGEKSDLCN